MGVTGLRREEILRIVNVHRTAERDADAQPLDIAEQVFAVALGVHPAVVGEDGARLTGGDILGGGTVGDAVVLHPIERAQSAAVRMIEVAAVGHIQAVLAGGGGGGVRPDERVIPELGPSRIGQIERLTLERLHERSALPGVEGGHSLLGRLADHLHAGHDVVAVDVIEERDVSAVDVVGIVFALGVIQHEARVAFQNIGERAAVLLVHRTLGSAVLNAQIGVPVIGRGVQGDDLPTGDTNLNVIAVVLVIHIPGEAVLRSVLAGGLPKLCRHLPRRIANRDSAHGYGCLARFILYGGCLSRLQLRYFRSQVHDELDGFGTG